MTPLHLLLGEGGPTLLLWLIALAAVLTLAAAGLEIALERAGGADPAALPDWFATHGPRLYVFGGVPATLIAITITLGLVLALGSDPERTSVSLLWPLLLCLVTVVAVLGCGVGSPLTQHWGLGVASLAMGVSLIFPLLFVVNTLNSGETGRIAYPGRLIFALAAALMLLAAIIAGSALVALIVTSVRTARALHDRRARVTTLSLVPGVRGSGSADTTNRRAKLRR